MLIALVLLSFVAFGQSILAAALTVTLTQTTTVTTGTVTRVRTVTHTVTKTRKTRTNIATTTTTSTLPRSTVTSTNFIVKYHTVTSSYSSAGSAARKPQAVTVTTTVTSNVAATTTITSTTTTTTRRLITKSRTTTSTSYRYPAKTTTVTRTVRVQLTTCAGKNPTSPFKLQVIDATATRTDKYNNIFPTIEPNPSFGDGFSAMRFTKSQEDSSVFNIDCVRRLYTHSPNWGNLFFTVSYFQPGFEITNFLNNSAYEVRGYEPIRCDITANGDDAFLACSSEDGAGPLPILQTCPLYGRWYKAPVVIGSYVPDQPRCNPFNFKELNSGLT